MLMKLPEGVTSFGYDGAEYMPAENGIVDVPEEAAAEAVRHGLTVYIPEEAPDEPDIKALAKGGSRSRKKATEG